MPLYFAESIATGEIKIGFSHDPAKRLKAVYRGGRRCRLLATFTPPADGHWSGDTPRGTDTRYESVTHGRLSKHRVEGEWFCPHDDVMLAAAIVFAKGDGADFERMFPAFMIDCEIGWRKYAESQRVQRAEKAA